MLNLLHFLFPFFINYIKIYAKRLCFLGELAKEKTI